MKAEELKELRLKAGLTQKELADLCEVTETSISHWETKQREIKKLSAKGIIAVISEFSASGARLI